MVARAKLVASLKTTVAVLMVVLVTGCDLDSSNASASNANADGAAAASTSPPASGTSSGTTAAPATSSVIGSAEVSWVPPQQNNDGSALTDLAGYRIYYGNSADNLSRVVNISTVGITLYVIDNLGAGTWYFAVRAFNAAGIESDLSNLASKTIG